MKKIRVLLIEDNRLLREGISAMLKKQPDMNVVTTVGNGENILNNITNKNQTLCFWIWVGEVRTACI